MKKMVLVIVPNLRIGSGVTSVIANHYNKLIQAGYQIDFCLMQDRESPYYYEIARNRGKIYIVPQGKENYPDKTRTPLFLKKLLLDRKYDIIHTHITGRFAVLVAYYAKKYQVPFRIYHAHNPRDIHDMKSCLRSLVYDNFCVMFHNKYLACSEEAGKSVFGNRDFSIIKNTINTKKFAFSEKSRRECRKRFSIDKETFVVGTVCRICYQKNPFYLIDIFEEIYKKHRNSVLLWAGSGELEKELERYVCSKKLSKNVILVGSVSEIADLYAAMDIFVLPSRYEGLGIAYLEAQASGLKTYASDVVPKETDITDLIKYLPLNVTPEYWARQIFSSFFCFEDREKYVSKVAAAGFDTTSNKELVDYYNQLK